MLNYVSIKHKQMSFVSNGGKFKLYTVQNGLIFPTPIQPRISFEHAIQQNVSHVSTITAVIRPLVIILQKNAYSARMFRKNFALSGVVFDTKKDRICYLILLLLLFAVFVKSPLRF
jgi:hypothetical protein